MQRADSRISGLAFATMFALASPMVALSGFLSLYVLMLSEYSRRHMQAGSGSGWEIASVGIWALFALGIAAIGLFGGVKSSLGSSKGSFIASAVLALMASAGVALAYFSVRQSAPLIPRDTIQVEIWDQIVRELPGGWASAALICVGPVFAWVGVCACAVANESQSTSRRVTVPIAIGCAVVLAAALLLLTYAVVSALIGPSML